MTYFEFDPKMHFGPMPDADQLKKLSVDKLAAIKSRRTYENFLKNLPPSADTTVILLKAIFFEAEHFNQKFPIFPVELLFCKISADDDILLLNESGILDFADFRLVIFKILSEIKTLNKTVFLFLSLIMEKFGQKFDENDEQQNDEIQFLSEEFQEKILAGETQKYCAQAWLNLLTLSNETLKQHILKIFLNEVIHKIGESGKICLDLLTKISKSENFSDSPSCLLGITCMIKLLIGFEDIEYVQIYEDCFYHLKNVKLIDSNVAISLIFLKKCVNLILQSTHLPVFMKSKILLA